MKNYLFKDSVILDAIEHIEATKKSIAVVVSKQNKLIGTITDGDIRRALLHGHDLDSKVENIMNHNPIYIHEGVSNKTIGGILISNSIEAVPVIDKNHNYLRTLHHSDLTQKSSNNSLSKHKELFALILAGGKGKRLMPITKDIPKPMIKIGEIPIIERQIISLKKLGITQIYISVNHLSKVIQDYFKNGSTWGVSLHYLEEQEFLGTAGPIKLMDQFQEILIINGDILSDINYIAMFNYHMENKSSLTIGAVSHHVEIPFGVLELEGENLIDIREKPSQNFLCNAGIYIASSKVLDFIPKNKHFDMTELIETMIEKEENLGVFPIHEYWADIGTPNQLHQANELLQRSSQ